ncbi:dihydroorotase [Mollicutes bacterium LVI A0078]|nr:dihydroorotase [Mollicutes bacterium LVI A0075]WOO91189.1 dihydroorotase [Mollicutes bacterium LVI A0078]
MLVIKNGKLIDNSGRLYEADIKIENERIVEIGTNLEAETTIDAKGKLVTPAFIDVHTHTRNPGQSYKESIESITESALAGGYSTLMAMPNTSPVIDDENKLTEVLEMLNTGKVKYYQYGALSKNLVSEEAGDYAAMKKAGAVALSNDGRGVQQTDSIYQMMKKCVEHDMLYVSHSEVDDILYNGVMHEGAKSKELNLPGILGSVESIAVAKEIMLATELDCKYHVCHMSSKMSVDTLRTHKGYGSKVSGEVSPHHLVLCDEDIPSDDPNYKMNPPLRSRSDREALIEGLNDGTIEIIATDHAPHSVSDKGNSFIGGAFGIVGLETAFDLLYSNLVLTGKVSLKTIVDSLTVNPARIFGVEGGRLEVGELANITIIDLDVERTIDVNEFKTLGRNTPFNGYQVHSKIDTTIIKGEIAYE